MMCLVFIGFVLCVVMSFIVGFEFDDFVVLCELVRLFCGVDFL